MRFEQIHNVLHHLAPDYHRKVSDFYAAMLEGDVSPRVQLMLDYLIDHEMHRALALSEFCSEASPHVQEKWIKGLEMNFPQAKEDVIEPGAGSNLDLLIKAAVNFKSTLIAYFDHLAEHCTDREAKDLFQSLKKQEERAMRRMIRHSQGLADL